MPSIHFTDEELSHVRNAVLFTLVMLKSQNEEGKILDIIEYADVPEMLKDAEQAVENEKALAAIFKKLRLP
jgi:hypothetical protein